MSERWISALLPDNHLVDLALTLMTSQLVTSNSPVRYENWNGRWLANAEAFGSDKFDGGRHQVDFFSF